VLVFDSGTEENHEKPLRRTSVLAEIRTEHLSTVNTSTTAAPRELAPYLGERACWRERKLLVVPSMPDRSKGRPDEV
jgi:hypothetical protein